MKTLKIILFTFSFFILGTLSVGARTITGSATVNIDSVDLCPLDAGVQTTLPCPNGDYCPLDAGIQLTPSCVNIISGIDLIASNPIALILQNILTE